MSRLGLFSIASAVTALALLSPAPRVSAQAPATPPTKSVYGKLLRVDKTLNSVLMEEDGGAKLAWRFDAKVIAEAARFKEGDPLIVIYRQDSPTLKRVTAIAFPGTAESPIYVNMTGDRVLIRSAPGVDGRCEERGGPISESVLPAGGLAELMDGCWCCAPTGGTCEPTTRSGNGRALLSQCF